MRSTSNTSHECSGDNATGLQTSDDALDSIVNAMEQMQSVMRTMQLKMERTDEAVRIMARGLDEMVPLLGNVVTRMDKLEKSQPPKARVGRLQRTRSSTSSHASNQSIARTSKSLVTRGKYPSQAAMKASSSLSTFGEANRDQPSRRPTWSARCSIEEDRHGQVLTPSSSVHGNIQNSSNISDNQRSNVSNKNIFNGVKSEVSTSVVRNPTTKSIPREINTTLQNLAFQTTENNVTTSRSLNLSKKVAAYTGLKTNEGVIRRANPAVQRALDGARQIKSGTKLSAHNSTPRVTKNILKSSPILSPNSSNRQITTEEGESIQEVPFADSSKPVTDTIEITPSCKTIVPQPTSTRSQSECSINLDANPSYSHQPVISHFTSSSSPSADRYRYTDKQPNPNRETGIHSPSLQPTPSNASSFSKSYYAMKNNIISPSVATIMQIATPRNTNIPNYKRNFPVGLTSSNPFSKSQTTVPCVQNTCQYMPYHVDRNCMPNITNPISFRGTQNYYKSPGAAETRSLICPVANRVTQDISFIQNKYNACPFNAATTNNSVVSSDCPQHVIASSHQSLPKSEMIQYHLRGHGNMNPQIISQPELITYPTVRYAFGSGTPLNNIPNSQCNVRSAHINSPGECARFLKPISESDTSEKLPTAQFKAPQDESASFTSRDKQQLQTYISSQPVTERSLHLQSSSNVETPSFATPSTHLQQQRDVHPSQQQHIANSTSFTADSRKVQPPINEDSLPGDPNLDERPGGTTSSLGADTSTTTVHSLPVSPDHRRRRRRHLVANSDSSSSGSPIWRQRPVDSTAAMKKRLVKAAREGRTQEMKLLLDSGVDANTIVAGDCTPLHRAAAQSQAAVVALLLQNGADVNAKDSYGRTALHMAAYNDPGCKCVQLLIDAGSDLESRDRSGRTPLHSAAKCSNMAAVRALVAAGANKASRDNKGRTPFDVAKADIVRLFLPTDPAREECSASGRH